MTVAEFLLLALLSIFWPLLFAFVVAALRTDRPLRLLVAFLLGALLTTIALGTLIVQALQHTTFVTAPRPEADPVVDVAVGALALAAAAALHRRPPRPRRTRSGGRIGGALAGTRLAFAAGIVLNLFPGVFPFVALKNIAELGTSNGTEILLVALFYVIMFASVEIPIVAYLVAPDRTQAKTVRVNAWVDAHARGIATWALAAGGGYLLARGLLSF